MRSTKDIVNEAVERTLDPCQRKMLIARLESKLLLHRLAVIFGFIAFGIYSVLYLFDREMDGVLMSLLFGMLILSIFSYTVTIQRLVQLRLEENRGKTEQGVPGQSARSAPVKKSNENFNP